MGAVAVIPHPWPALVLALGGFRLLRLLAWDAFPPVARARAWVLGQEVVSVGSPGSLMGLTADAPQLEFRYRRPLLAELVHCPYCLGLWVAGLVYGVWLEWPADTLYALAPFALGAAYGLLARNLDP